MESPTPPSLLQHLWKSTLLSGILAVVLGILVLTWPGITIVIAAIFFGAYLLITGIAQVIFAFSLHVSAGGRVLLFVSGAAALYLAVAGPIVLAVVEGSVSANALRAHADRIRAAGARLLGVVLVGRQSERSAA